MTTLVGFTSSTPLAAGNKLRATWTFLGSSWLPDALNNAPQRAIDIQKKLPSLGFIPLSQPSAVDGDAVIVFDIQLGTKWGAGVVAASIIEPLDHVGTTWLDSYWDINLTRLEKIVVTSSTDLQQQQDAARRAGNEAANTNELFDKIGALVGVAGKTLAIAAVVAAGVAAYLLLRKR